MMLTESMTDIPSQHRRATDLFYSRFLERYPDVRRFFEKVDLREQGVILTMSLRVLTEYFVHRYPALEEYLRLLGKNTLCEEFLGASIPTFATVFSIRSRRFSAITGVRTSNPNGRQPSTWLRTS